MGIARMVPKLCASIFEGRGARGAVTSPSEPVAIGVCCNQSRNGACFMLLAVLSVSRDEAAVFSSHGVCLLLLESPERSVT